MRDVTDPDRVRELFLDALDQPPSERAAFVRDGAGDPALEREVLSLLGHHERAADFLAVPVPETEAFSVAAGPPVEFTDFEIEREIGRGGMGVVYLARQRSTGAAVALKVLNAGMSLTATGVARFRTEARTTSRLSHPAIVSTLSMGVEQGRHFIASTYVEGSTLGRELDPDLRLGVGPRIDDHRAIAAFVAAVADALAHAHAHGVLHRDVKPSNILVDLQGRPHLTDFGLARDLREAGHTRTGDVAGTAAYMSPEQALGRVHAIDHRTDVFSLGVVLFELLHGRRPFEGATALDLAQAIAERPLPRARDLDRTIPRPLRQVCAKALEKDPRDRYATMAEFAADLRGFAEGDRVHVRGPSPWRRLRRTFDRRRRLVVITTVTVVVALVGVAAGLSIQRSTLTPVRIESDPSGVEVFEVRIADDGSRLLPPRVLGSTPLRTRLAPGHVRLLLRDGERAFAELQRYVPRRDATTGGAEFLVRARVVEVDSTLARMIPIASADSVPGHDEPGTLFGPRRVHVPAFAIDEREVTVGEFRRFLAATRTPPPPLWATLTDDRADHLPASGVPWDHARAFAEWAGKRLPTYEEWQLAARGPDGRIHPWGTEPMDEDELRARVCVGRDQRGDAAQWVVYLAVGCEPGRSVADRSPFGLVDVLGSVAEWTGSAWRSPRSDGALQLDPDRYAVAGTSWNTPARLSRLDVVASASTGVSVALDVGFRCARSLDPFTPAP